MRFFRKKPPWYAAGLAFECARCGNCCAGPIEGYVWVSPADIAAIARDLGISQAEVSKKYVRRVGRRFSLIERDGNNDCIFLVGDGQGGRQCRIYRVRPTQCRTWPFWKSNLRSPASWAAAGMRCPGINTGPLVTSDEIEALANQTSE